MKNDIGICTGQVYITLNLFIIVLEACLKLRADLTNGPMTLPTSGRSGQLSRAPNTVNIAVKSYINVRPKQLFSCLDRKSK